jgi:hypothetical protein
MKDRQPPIASEYTKWLKEKANLELTIADARMGIPAYERQSIISQIPYSLSLTRVGLTLFKNNIYTPPFDPRVFGNISMWYDGGDRTSMTVNVSNQITRWNDKSGNGYHLIAGSGPTITSASNAVGYDIVFNGSQTLKNVTLSPAISTTQFTYFIVLVNKSGASFPYGRFITGSNVIQDNADVNGVCISSFDVSNPNSVFFILGGVSPLLVTTVTANTYTIASFVWSTPTATLFINGGSVPGFTSANTLTFSKFAIGATPTNENNRLGNGCVVNEFVSFTSALTTTQRQQVEGYLAWKWGLQASLPSNHPYFNAKP